MEILIVRHGSAVEEAPGLGDAGRWLTGKGRKATRKVGKWLTDQPDRVPTEIWTSPLVRAVQTAEILAEKVALTDNVLVAGELSPARDPGDLLKRFGAHSGAGQIAVVGHEPGLSRVAMALLGDIPWPGFKKSGVLGVSWKGRGLATFRFLLNPKDLELITDVTALRKA